MEKKHVGLYLHIPFCVRKCPYCDFYSLPFSGEMADAYTAALVRAMECQTFGKLGVDTVYFGGGTPSVLGPERLAKLLDTAARCFAVAADAEVTLEVNPGTVKREDWRKLRQSGFNRVSLGVQSMEPTELAALGRIHTDLQAAQAIEDASASGFQNISADVMLSVPGQTAESLSRTLDTLTQLPISHISAYLLKIEEGTPFMDKNTARLCPDEDEAARLYLNCADTLVRQGFCHYEISNFAKADLPSRHNLKYWRCEEYLGLGPSAHSFMEGERFYFPRDLKSFCRAKNPFGESIPDGEGGGFLEYAMLRLRLQEGLNLAEASRHYVVDADAIAERAEPLKRQGLLTLKEGVISLTPEGWLLSNAVTGRLLF